MTSKCCENYIEVVQAIVVDEGDASFSLAEKQGSEFFWLIDHKARLNLLHLLYYGLG